MQALQMMRGSVDELLVEIPSLLERVLDSAVVESVEDVGDEAGPAAPCRVSREGASMRARGMDWRRMTSKPRSMSSRRVSASMTARTWAL